MPFLESKSGGGVEPQADRYMAILEKGPNRHAERLAALVALVNANPGVCPCIFEMRSTPPQ